MRAPFWTLRARSDLAAIHTFISQDSPQYATVVASRLIAAVERLVTFASSGRIVPEFSDVSIREVIQPPYRIVYRIIDDNTIHILTIHHSAKQFPTIL